MRTLRHVLLHSVEPFVTPVKGIIAGAQIDFAAKQSLSEGRGQLLADSAGASALTLLPNLVGVWKHNGQWATMAQKQCISVLTTTTTAVPLAAKLVIETTLRRSVSSRCELEAAFHGNRVRKMRRTHACIKVSWVACFDTGLSLSGNEWDETPGRRHAWLP